MKKIFGKILGGFIIIIFVLQFHVMVYADEITDLQSQQASNEEKMKDVENQKDQVTQEKSETLKQVEAIESEIADYESEISYNQSIIENLSQSTQNYQSLYEIYSQRDHLKKELEIQNS